MAQAVNGAGKIQPCMRMGEHGLQYQMGGAWASIGVSDLWQHECVQFFFFFSSVLFPFPCAQLPYVRM